MNPRTTSRSKRSAAKAEAAAKTRPFVAHHLAPPHEILSEEESQKVLAELKTRPERLPKILAGDPGLLTDPKYAALRDAKTNLLGRLVRVRRPSATAGEAIAYRVVVSTSGGD